jgi:transposase
MWGIVTWFFYAARRVHCPEHGVVVEHVPWSDGKRPVTITMMCFLSRWARRLSWRETARAFGTSWECVYRSVQWFVEWGLAHRILEGIRAIGIDEIHWGKGKGANGFLTVIYQIDGHCRRLLWVGCKRTQATLRRGLTALGPEVVGGLRFVCTDMWRPYLNVVAAKIGQALHVLDRFHITSHLNQALDQVRRTESGRLRAAGRAQAEQLKNSRRLSRRQRQNRGHQLPQPPAQTQNSQPITSRPAWGHWLMCSNALPAISCGMIGSGTRWRRACPRTWPPWAAPR